MSTNPEALKVKKDAAVSALFSLYKAAGDASSAVLDLINHLETTGLDVADLRSAFTGVPLNQPAKPESVVAAPKQVDAKPSSQAAENVPVSSQSVEPEEAEGKKKPKRAPKDPNAPKRPLNAFLKFRNQESKKISEERKSNGEPDLSRTDMSLVVKERWENLPESVRENLIQESKGELERYHTNLASYKEAAGNDKEPLTQLESSQPELSQLSQAPAVATQEEEASEPSEQPTKRKQKKKDDSKKEDKDKKKRKKHSD